MGQYKDENGTTRVGDLLRNLGDVGKPILKAAAGLTGQAWLSNVADGITTSKEIKEEQKKLAFELLELDTADRANARGMQVEALKQDDVFSKRFVYYLAMFWSLIAAGYLFAVTFIEYPEANTRIVDTITGFLLGTIIAGIITYFFGSSEGSKSKDKLMALINKARNS